MVTLPIFNTEGKEVDTIKLNSTVFDGKINLAVIHQAVNAYRANSREGIASTKTRGEVSGGGKKPWRQKGTGRARVGSSRSPLWRHGGVIFGPHPRDFSYKLPDKIKSLALKSSLNIKVNENCLTILDDIELKSLKTKEAAVILKNLKIKPYKKSDKNNTLLLLDKIDNNLKLSFRNIGFLRFNLATGTNAYEIMRHKRIIVTKDGLTALVNKLKND